MKKLPSLSSLAHSDSRQALSAWLDEWTLEQAAPTEDTTTAEPLARPANPLPTEEGSKPGDIWLLYPSRPALAARPRYLAVLAHYSDGRQLVAPFSRFSRPATPGELALDGDALLLRVLCVWNARIVTALPPGWRVGSLTEPELQQALAVQASLTQNQPLSPTLTRRIGPPLQHPLDPRWEYLDRERDWVDQGLPGKRLHAPLAYPSSSGQAPWPMAAEPRADYQTDPDSRE